MPEIAPLTDDERASKLWKLYDALLLYFLQAMQADKPPSAFLVNVIRHFLAHNGINVSTRAGMKSGLSALASGSDLPFKVD